LIFITSSLIADHHANRSRQGTPMLTPDQRRWCLDQAIDIIKLAPADNLATHDRLKRVYKRLLSLTEQVHATEAPKVVKDTKDAKAPNKKP
jgi:hypothetical protein